jgi:multiple sugar transport system substrate-binding protein
MDLDASKPIPLYFQVKTLLMEQISSGAYLPGDQLPTEHEICAKYGISRTPVHRALSELADEGVVIRQRRRGTVVNPHWLPSKPQQDDVKVVVANREWVEYVERSVPDDLDVSVVAVGYPNLHRHISRAVAEGVAPDLILVDSVWVREFTDAGILWPLDELAPAWVAAEYSDFVPRFEHMGRPYAVSAEANVAGLWYRRDTLDSLDLDPPRTWDELASLGARLAHSTKEAPLAMPLGINAGETTTYCLVALLAANGAGVTNETRVTLDSAETVETLEFIARSIADELVSIQAVTFEWDRAAELMATGHASMSIGGTYEAPTIAEAAGLELDALDEHIGFAPLPHGPRGPRATVIGGMAYAIPRQAKRPQDAMRLLRDLVEPASIARLAFATGTLPGRRSVVEAVADDLPLVRVTSDVIDSAQLRPETIAYNRVSRQLQLMVESVVLDRTTPEEAASRTARYIGAITGLPLDGDHG